MRHDADPFDPGPDPGPVNLDDIVGIIATLILVWLSLAAWFYWPPFD